MVHEYSDNRNEFDAVDTWDSPATVQEDSNNRAVLRSLLSSLDAVDDSLTVIYDQHHINTASGNALDRIGEFVGVDRQTGEGDDTYRSRIKGRFRAATIEPTTDNFTEFVATLLNTNMGNFRLLRGPNSPVVTVSALPNVWESAGLTNQTLANLLDDGVPAGHAVQIQEEGTFRLKVDGEVDDADQGLTSDSIETGGTLSADVL